MRAFSLRRFIFALGVLLNILAAAFMCVFLILSMSQAYAASKNNPDPDLTIRPLAELMSVSTAELPKAAYDDDGDDSDPNQTVGQMLAIPLAYLMDGTNTIQGHCDKSGDSACEVIISHRHGDDVWTRRIQFNSVGGKPDINSIRCPDAG